MRAITPARLALVAVVVGSASWLSGCGAIVAPASRPQRASALAQAQTSHEYPSHAPRQTASRGWPAAVAAVVAFARAYTNWDARSVGREMRILAARSVGQARSAMQLAAVQASSDYELRHGGIANHGTVEAVASLAGGGGRYVVVTRESTTATAGTAYQGLKPAWHVTIATVIQLRSGQWVLSGWQPES